MNAQQQAVAQFCLDGAEDNNLTFPEILGHLAEAGFESYAVDLRRATATYYLADGEGIELVIGLTDEPVAPAFDAASLGAAIHEAQALAPGYSYKGFKAKAKAAGCAGYLVSLLGRRAVYFGRTGETHVELFPGR